MNIGLQKHTLEKKLEKEGVEPDLIDTSKLGELDPTLHLDEQVTQFKEKFPTLFSPEETDEERVEHQRKQAIKDEARRANRNRDPFNLMIDQSIQADTVFESPTEDEFEKWRKNPDETDISGIDTKLDAEERIKAEPPEETDPDEILL